MTGTTARWQDGRNGRLVGVTQAATQERPDSRTARNDAPPEPNRWRVIRATIWLGIPAATVAFWVGVLAATRSVLG